MIIHLLIGVFTAFIIYVAQPGTTLFSWHPVLMTLAIALFMFEGIMQFSNQNSFIRSFTRPVKVTAHWICQTCSLVFLLLGFIVIYWNKHSHNKPHFTTWHGVLGLTTVILALVSSSGGFMAKNYSLLPPTVNLGSLKYAHAVAGMVTSLVGCSALLLGLYSNWFASQVILPIQLAVAVFPIAFGLTIAIQVTQHYFPVLWKLKHPSDQYNIAPSATQVDYSSADTPMLNVNSSSFFLHDTEYHFATSTGSLGSEKLKIEAYQDVITPQLK